VVGTNIPSGIPLLGGYITRVLLAGDTVSGLTLTRFYAIHTLLLPALTAVCVGVHIYMVRIHGISEHSSVSVETAEPPGESSYHSFPEHVSRAFFVFAGVFLIILLLAVFVEIPREDIAGAIDPDYVPRPEWYYAWLFQLLTFFSGRAEVIGSIVIPAGLILLLFCLPFLSARPYKRPADRPVATAAAVACLVGIVYLSGMGIADSRPSGNIVRIPDRSLSPSEVSGLKIFAEKKCSYCHHILGAGGRRAGPDLSNVVARDRTKSWLMKFVNNPQSISSWSVMPKYDLDDDELSALTDFILALDFDRYPMKTITAESIRMMK
jgi:ubiquinol-cytochrome c reductase cytochrome b subunit